MAQGADITVNDGTATPVAIAFKIMKASPALSIWKDRRLSPTAKQPEITVSADVPSSTAKVRKCEVRVAVPVVNAVTGEVIDFVRFRGVFDQPVSASTQNINDCYAYAANGLNIALVKGAVRDQDTIIG